MSIADADVERIVSAARSMIPTLVWAVWPSHSMDKWTKELTGHVKHLLAEAMKDQKPGPTPEELAKLDALEAAAKAAGHGTDEEATWIDAVLAAQPRLRAALREKDIAVAAMDRCHHAAADQRDAAQSRVKELERALIDHRADLHQYSTRPCQTCENSAKLLGIHGKVPNTCADGHKDRAALAQEEKPLPDWKDLRGIYADPDAAHEENDA